MAFSATEVSAILGLSAVEVNNLFDEVAVAGGARVGGGRRTVEYRNLFTLLLAQELIRCNLKPQLRHETLTRAMATRASKVEVPGTSLSVLAGPHRQRALEGLERLLRAEGTIVSSQEIMHGEPCVRGYRVSAYTLAAIAEAHGLEEARAAYPFLKINQIEDARTFVRAYPRRGRPKGVALKNRTRSVTKVIKQSKHGSSG